MRNVSSFMNHLLIVGLTAGLGGLADARANTASEEVLQDLTTEAVVEIPVQSDEVTATESTETASDTETEPQQPQTVEPPANDYGDAILNQLYNG